ECAMQQIERLEAGHDHRYAVLLCDGLVLVIAHDRAHVAGGQEPLYAIRLRTQDRFHCGRHEHMRDQHAEVEHTAMCSFPDCHRVCGGCRLEADRKEDDLPVRILLCDAHGIERRVHDAHIATGGLDAEQVGLAPG